MATAPIDYSIDIGNAVGNALQGFQGGFNIGSVMQQRQAQQEQQAAQQQAAARMQADLSAVAGNPNASGADYAGLMTRYPQLSENLKRSWDVLNESQKQTSLDQMSQTFSALKSGKPEIAKDYLQSIANAAENSGDTRKQAGMQAIIKQIDMDPAGAKLTVGMRLASILGPEKFTQAYGQIEAEERAQDLAPEELKKKRAEATIKAEEAKAAPQRVALELQKQGWDINKIQEDIRSSKENTRLRAMEVSLSRENNQLKRKELEQKISEASEKQLEKVREKAADLESARGQMDNMLNTADRILATPKGVVGSAAGPISSRVFTASQDTADFEELVNTLGSQSFLAQIPNIKGMGALSNAEGEKLQAALQNLSLRQSPERLLSNVREAQRLILKSRQNLAKRYGAPDTGPDRPDAAPAASDFGGGTAAPAPANQRSVVVDY